jgi:hypothetical protein
LRARSAGALAAASLAFACTVGGPRGPVPADPVADRFIRAWNEGDGAEMAALVPRSRWRRARFETLLRRTATQGELRSLHVERTSAAEETDGEGGSLGARVPYAITYTSTAAARPARLEGSFRLSYERELRRWSVEWQRRLLWPGVEGARRLRVERRWLPRAAIVDRRGRPLARGPARRRRYPFGAVGGSLVGHLAPVAREDVGSAYRPGDLAGASGLEAAYDRRLAGKPATRLVVLDRRGRVLETLGRTPGRPGRRVRATLDARLQRDAERAFGDRVGGAVVLDPSSGNVLAAVSSGEFDPGNYVGVAEVSPFNRALSGLYPPGSAMKVVTASAALEVKAVTPRTQLTGPAEYRGVRNFESGNFGVIDFSSALRNSVNTAFAQVAEKVGTARLTRFARAFGFGRPPAMALGAARSSFPRPVDDYELMWGAIGQAQVLATPLQMASVAATVANGGRRMEPRASSLDPRRGARVVSRHTARTMTSLMSAVVEAGTGVRAALPGIRVAGKTGTAEVDVDGIRRNHAWFICFAPAANPTVAVAVVAEYGGVGGEVAAPLAARVLQAVLPHVS